MIDKDFLQKINTHVVDILGNVKGRDQPIMLMNRAAELVFSLGKSALMSDDYVFFDPFCKGGEIILAAAFMRSYCKWMENKQTADINNIKNDMFHEHRYYALAPDERHFRLSIRTFLGNEKSHNPIYTEIIRNGNYLSETNGRLDEKKFKGELENMIEYIKTQSKNKKIVAIGNPPYQESDGGFGGSATAIYNHFVETLMDNRDISEFIVVIPSRWFAVGKGVDEFRKKVLGSSEIKSIHYFSKSKTIFPTVDVLGGVCFLHHQKDYIGKTIFIEENVQTEIDLAEFDIIPDDPNAYSIIRKVKGKHNQFIDEIAWSRNPFGLSGTFFRDNPEEDKNNKSSIRCYSRGRKIKLASKDSITKNKEKIDYFKVVIPAAYAPGSKQGVRRVTLPVKQFFILDKNEITTETYTVIDIFKTRVEAERFVKYLQTDFARYLLGLRKITQHIPKDRWAWVPYMDISQEWTDEKLFKHFGLTDVEISNIRRKVKEWS